jgi:NAD(P)-dependent dehydrogenase (short-subunit alcohol dehydrogenase family)
MERRIAIIIGGLRGLGRAMALGLARDGHSVLAVEHIDTDVVEIGVWSREVEGTGLVVPRKANKISAIPCRFRLLLRSPAIQPRIGARR